VKIYTAGCGEKFSAPPQQQHVMMIISEGVTMWNRRTEENGRSAGWRLCRSRRSNTDSTMAEISEAELRKIMAVPITKSADMVPAETMNEAKDIITMSVDKFVAAKNYELMAKLIKETMDKKFGPLWHCVIGEGFGFEVSYQQRNMIFIYYGEIGILVYKC
jgi:dynein light chain 4